MVGRSVVFFFLFFLDNPELIKNHFLFFLCFCFLFYGSDSVNVLKMQNIIHEYERVIEKENQRHVLLAQEVKKLREERKEMQQMTEKNRELKSLLEYNKVEWDSDISSLR